MQKIKLSSRYRDVDTVYHHIDDTCGIITSSGEFVRCILSNDNKTIEAVDFEGGPMISIGDEIPGVNKKIKAIESCFLIELE